MALNTTSRAISALSMPAPDRAGMMGWKVPATKSMTTVTGPFFSAGASAAAAPPPPHKGSSTANRSATSVPMTT